jgi:hypothetical protein
MAKFKEKLLVVETLNEQQKMRLLEQMAYELKKAGGPPVAEVRNPHAHPRRALQAAFLVAVWLGLCIPRSPLPSLSAANTTHTTVHG